MLVTTLSGGAAHSQQAISVVGVDPVVLAETLKPPVFGSFAYGDAAQKSLILFGNKLEDGKRTGIEFHKRHARIPTKILVDPKESFVKYDNVKIVVDRDSYSNRPGPNISGRFLVIGTDNYIVGRNGDKSYTFINVKTGETEPNPFRDGVISRIFTRWEAILISENAPEAVLYRFDAQNHPEPSAAPAGP